MEAAHRFDASDLGGSSALPLHSCIRPGEALVSLARTAEESLLPPIAGTTHASAASPQSLTSTKMKMLIMKVGYHSHAEACRSYSPSRRDFFSTMYGEPPLPLRASPSLLLPQGCYPEVELQTRMQQMAAAGPLKHSPMRSLRHDSASAESGGANYRAALPAAASEPQCRWTSQVHEGSAVANSSGTISEFSSVERRRLSLEWADLLSILKQQHREWELHRSASVAALVAVELRTAPLVHWCCRGSYFYGRAEDEATGEDLAVSLAVQWWNGNFSYLQALLRSAGGERQLEAFREGLTNTRLTAAAPLQLTSASWVWRCIAPPLCNMLTPPLLLSRHASCSAFNRRSGEETTRPCSGAASVAAALLIMVPPRLQQLCDRLRQACSAAAMDGGSWEYTQHATQPRRCDLAALAAVAMATLPNTTDQLCSAAGASGVISDRLRQQSGDRSTSVGSAASPRHRVETLATDALDEAGEAAASICCRRRRGRLRHRHCSIASELLGVNSVGSDPAAVASSPAPDSDASIPSSGLDEAVEPPAQWRGTNRRLQMVLRQDFQHDVIAAEESLEYRLQLHQLECLLRRFGRYTDSPRGSPRLRAAELSLGAMRRWSEYFVAHRSFWSPAPLHRRNSSTMEALGPLQIAGCKARKQSRCGAAAPRDGAVLLSRSTGTSTDEDDQATRRRAAHHRLLQDGLLTYSSMASRRNRGRTTSDMVSAPTASPVLLTLPPLPPRQVDLLLNTSQVKMQRCPFNFSLRHRFEFRAMMRENCPTAGSTTATNDTRRPVSMPQRRRRASRGREELHRLLFDAHFFVTPASSGEKDPVAAAATDEVSQRQSRAMQSPQDISQPLTTSEMSMARPVAPAVATVLSMPGVAPPELAVEAMDCRAAFYHHRMEEMISATAAHRDSPYNAQMNFIGVALDLLQ